MSQSIAEELARVPMSPALMATLTRAADYARQQNHPRVTLEHMLLALTADSDATLVLQASNISVDRLTTDVSTHLASIEQSTATGGNGQMALAPDFKRVLEAAAAAAQQGRRQVSGAIVLAAIVGDGKSTAAQALRAQGLTFEHAIKALQRPARPAQQAQPAGPAAPPQSTAAAPRPAPGAAPSSAPRPPQTAPQQTAPAAPLPASPPAADQRAPQRPVPPDVAAAAASEAQAPQTSPAPSLSPPASSSAAAMPAETQAADPMPARPQPPAIPPRQQQPVAAAPQSAPAPQQPPLAANPDRGEPQQRPPNRPTAPAPQPAYAAATAPPQSAPEPAPYPPSTPWPPPQPAQRQPLPSAPLGAPPRRESAPAPAHGPALGPPTASTPRTPPEPREPRRRPAPAQAASRQASQRRPPPEAAESAGGQLIENIPRFMRVAVPLTVEVRLVASGDGGPQGGPDPYAMPATRAMSVRLTAADGGFQIDPLAAETQWIDGAPSADGQALARWRWSVAPQRRGRGRLQLAVSARRIGPEGISAETPLPVQMVSVTVRRNYSRSAFQLLGWLAAIGAGAGLAMLGGGIGPELLKLFRRWLGI